MKPKTPQRFTGGRVPALRLRFLPAWALMAATAAMVGGCQLLPPASPDTTRFFVLAAPGSSELVAERPAGRLQIGLRDIELPDYLRTTKSMVVREGANEVRYQDGSRWAEPLGNGVLRLLKESLLKSPDVRGVDAHPMRGDVTHDYDITVRIVRCEGVRKEGYVASFSATYEIVAADGSGRVLANRIFTAPEAAWDGKDFAQLAKLLSDDVTALGAKIVEDLSAEKKPRG